MVRVHSRSVQLPRLMNRFPVRIVLLACLAVLAVCSSSALAQSPPDAAQRIQELEARVRQLEAENQKLRYTIGVFPYLQQAADGHRVEIVDDGKPVATLVIAREGWNARAEDVGAVSKSVAETIFRAIPPADTPTILILRSEHGPIALSGRGPQGEYIVLLNSGDRLWAQVAYQLAHELGHVLCRDLRPGAPQQWLEESFCEAMSIWTMEQMAKTWKTAPPYPNWASYAGNLQKYVDNVRASVEHPESIHTWYAEQREHLDATPADRPKNRIVAEEIVKQGLDRPKFLQAFLYLRKNEPAANTIEAVLQSWRAACPDEMQTVPAEMAELLGVTLER